MATTPLRKEVRGVKVLASSHSKRGPDLRMKLRVPQKAQNESLPCCISWLPIPPTPASQTERGPELNPRRLSARPYVPFCPVMAASLHVGPWPLWAPCQVQIQPPRLRPPESPEPPASALSRRLLHPKRMVVLTSHNLLCAPPRSSARSTLLSPRSGWAA